MDHLTSKRWQIRQQLQSLLREIRRWQIRCRQGAFRIHHSQVSAFVRILRNLERRVSEATTSPDFSLEEARQMARMTLGLFRIWEFLRAKLAQRLDSHLCEHLRIADELAWELYSPSSLPGKEPPLAFLNGGFSPFILTRHQRFSAEAVPNEMLTDRSLTKALERVPFPVVGLPWYQAASIAELPVLAHELGHCIEADLQLETTLDQLIAAAIPAEARRGLWLGWRSEVFADVYGCATLGPAFVSALAGFLAPPPAGESIEQYPPATLRVGLNLYALEQLGFVEEAAALDRRWRVVFGPALTPEQEAMAEGKGVVEAFLCMPFAHRPHGLQGDAPTVVASLSESKRVAEDVLLSQPIGQGYTTCQLVAAARFAHDQAVEQSSGRSPDRLANATAGLKAALTANLHDDLRAGQSQDEAHLAEQRGLLQQIEAAWLKNLMEAGL